jgi:hypothetical protein
VVDPLRGILELGGTEPALAGAPDLPRDHEIHFLEDPDVLLHPVEREPERLGQLADRRRSVAEALEDAPAGRIREREERPIEGRVIVHRSAHYNAEPLPPLLRREHPAHAGRSSEVRNDAPALMLLGMAVIMTVPMVGWMRYRGHGWLASMEMSASMFVPTFGVIALLGGGLVGDIGTLLVIEHVAMLPSMLAAMLMRGEEYSGHVHRHRLEATA